MLYALGIWSWIGELEALVFEAVAVSCWTSALLSPLRYRMIVRVKTTVSNDRLTWRVNRWIAFAKRLAPTEYV